MTTVSDTPPIIVIEHKEIVFQTRPPVVLQQVPGVGPPGSIDGGFSVNGHPPFNITGSIEGQGGSLVVAAGLHRFYMTRPGKIGYIQFSAGQSPAGQEAVFDLNKNGTSVFLLPIHRPMITPGTNVSNLVVPDDEDFIGGDFYTIDCDQRGTTVVGGAVTFTLWYF